MSLNDLKFQNAGLGVHAHLTLHEVVAHLAEF